MAFGQYGGQYGYQQPVYGAGYYPQQQGQPMQDQLAQLRGAQYAQPMQQPMQSAPPTQAQPMPQAQGSSGVIWVQGEAGAKSYLVAPNNSVLLMDSESSTFYIKMADASGMPSMKTFDYVERQASSQKQAQPVFNSAEYVTRAEFDAVVAKLEALTSASKEPVRRRAAKEVTEDGQSGV